MFEAKRALQTILATIDGLTVVYSSRLSARVEYPLPAVVIDFESKRPDQRAENNLVLTNAHRLPVQMHVAAAGPGRTQEQAEDDLEQWIDLIEGKIQGAHGNDYEIDEYYSADVPFGKQPALCGAFMLTLND